LDTRDGAIALTNISPEIPKGRQFQGGAVPSKLITEATDLQNTPQKPSVHSHNPLFPGFLLPGQFNTHLQAFREVIAASQTFIPLMPLYISRRLIENSFIDATAPHQILSKSHFLSLLEAQYATGVLYSADNPARWAIVNAIIALAVRFKTASGSEAALSDITQAFYQNSIKVLPELILQEPKLVSVQALLSMALFAWNVIDIRAFVMLATNASKLLELSSLRPDLEIGLEEMDEYGMVFRTIDMFNKTIVDLPSMDLALHGGLSQGISR